MANTRPCLSPSQQPSSKLTDDSFRPHTVFLAWPQGASQFLDTFCCLAGTFVFLVFILVLISSFSDILVNLSPCQGFDLFVFTLFRYLQILIRPLVLSWCLRQAQGYFALLFVSSQPGCLPPSKTPVLDLQSNFAELHIKVKMDLLSISLTEEQMSGLGLLC